MSEIVTYKAPPIFTVQHFLELQKMVLDPDTRQQCLDNQNQNQRLIARSASMKNEDEKQSIIQKQLELRRMVLDNLW